MYALGHWESCQIMTSESTLMRPNATVLPFTFSSGGLQPFFFLFCGQEHEWDEQISCNSDKFGGMNEC